MFTDVEFPQCEERLQESPKALSSFVISFYLPRTSMIFGRQYGQYGDVWGRFPIIDLS